MPFFTQGKTNWKYILIVVVLAVICGGILHYYSKFPRIEYPPVKIQKAEKKVTITTDKTEYEMGETIKITVKNNLDKSICFESCNTYYLLKKKDGSWEELGKKLCEVITITECIKPGETKIFEYMRSWGETGTYKFAVPIFFEDDLKDFPSRYYEIVKTIYSNEFEIKEGKMGKIIAFDVSHNNRTKNYSKFLDNFREAGFEVKFITEEINEESLENVDTLILTIHYSNYLPSELEVINKFLEKGGNLLVLGDFIGLDDINRVISQLGVRLVDCILPWGWKVIPVSDHILVKNVEELSFPASACIEIKNKDFKAILHAPEWPLLVVKENKNKILISGDSNFCDDEYIIRASNRVFCKNITFWLKQSPLEQETANWKTYRNEEYGFEVKYPPEWIIIKESAEKETKLEYYVVFADEKETKMQREKQAGEIKCAVGIYIYDNETKLSLYDWAINKWGKPEDRELGKISKIKINDLKGIKYEFMSMGRETNILFSNDNKVIDIQTTFDGCENLSTVFNKMLSTFRFLAPEEITANWKIYRNEEYGIEIKYPPDWLVEEVKSDRKLFYSLFYPSGEITVYPIELSIWENPKHLSIKEWIKEQSGFTILGVREISEITVDDYQGIKLIESGRIRLPKGGLTKGWFNKESIYISRENLVYSLTTIINHKYFNQMLSTFRFLK